MRIGLQVRKFDWPGGVERLGPTLGRIARNAEHAGFYSRWVDDHRFQIPGDGESNDPMLEGWIPLAFVAGQTQRLKIGTMVTGVTYRYPGMLVKKATTLDVLSVGRSYFGIGAAWYEFEHVSLGIPFPPVKECFEMQDEVLHLAHQR